MGTNNSNLATALGDPDVVFTRDLRAQGLEASERRRVTAGLHRVRRGAYATAKALDPQMQHLLAVKAAIGSRQGVVASHTSAAVVHGLWVPPEMLTNVHLTAVDPHVKDSSRNGVHLHAGPVSPANIAPVDGIAATPIPRTVADCATMLPFVDGVVLADQALQVPDVTRHALDQALGERGRRRGVARARRILAACDGGAESPGESRMRLIVVEAGFEVDSQVEVYRSDGTLVGRLDLKLRDHPVFLEFDGRKKYQMGDSPEAVVWAEKLRFDELHELGLEGIRVVWNHLARPDQIVQRIHRAVARSQARAVADQQNQEREGSDG